MIKISGLLKYLALLWIFWPSIPLAQPALPSGLDGGDNPTSSGAVTPDKTDATPTTDNQKAKLNDFFTDWQISGFVDHRLGGRLTSDPNQETASLGEARAQIKAIKNYHGLTATFRGDFIADAVSDDRSLNLDQGRGIIDLREANIFWRPNNFVDIKAGRQILTWGTGEFIFLNDLFPKDFRSFFIGRPDSYLKAPSDAIKTSFYSDLANLDVVYTPKFNPDRFLSGQRLSIFNPFTNQISGDDRKLSFTTPNKTFQQDEWAIRLNKTVASHELAAYAYDGYWKSPNSIDLSQNKLTFDRLSTYGASWRGTIPHLSGLGKLEISYYDSRSDRDGRRPTIPNSQWRGLIGYNIELVANFDLGLQYYTEHIADYDALVANAPSGSNLPDETRHVITTKFQRNWPEQQINASVFVFYSPNGGDGYLRPRIDWSVTDNLSVHGGANVFFGSDNQTQFGQLDDNDNVFIAMQLGF